jgi:hypothetical protein
MSFLEANIEARPASLLVMASGGDHDKRPWGKVPSHDGHQSRSRQARMDAALGWASSSSR